MVGLVSALLFAVFFTSNISAEQNKGSAKKQQTALTVVRSGDHAYKGYNGLADTKKLNTLLAAQEYGEVLKHLYSEKDREKRLTWLKQQALEGHVVCAFELSKEYGRLQNMEECYVWLDIAFNRLMQDLACNNDESLEPRMALLSVLLQGSYLRDLMLDMYDPAKFSDRWKAEEACLQMIKKCVKRAYQMLSEWQKYPSPAWLSCHCEEKKCAPTAKQLKPKEIWKDVRKKIVAEYLDDCELWQECDSLMEHKIKFEARVREKKIKQFGLEGEAMVQVSP